MPEKIKQLIPWFVLATLFQIILCLTIFPLDQSKWLILGLLTSFMFWVLIPMPYRNYCLVALIFGGAATAASSVYAEPYGLHPQHSGFQSLLPHYLFMLLICVAACRAVCHQRARNEWLGHAGMLFGMFLVHQVMTEFEIFWYLCSINVMAAGTAIGLLFGKTMAVVWQKVSPKQKYEVLTD